MGSNSTVSSTRKGNGKRRLFPFYYMRIVIRITPFRGLYWPARDFSSNPQELDLG
jgi:hypothetical protein